MVEMIASWGIGGKSTVALALAAQLSERKANVVVINTDTAVPALPIYLPNELIGSNGSLGELLASNEITYQNLKRYIHLHKQSSRIGFMGLSSGETYFTYQTAFYQEKMASLVSVLGETVFDFIIYDCVTNPLFDPITQMALQNAKFVLRSITPDVRGLEFEKTQLGWLGNIEDMRVERHIRILKPTTTVTPVDEVVAVIGQADYKLPYSVDIYSKYTAGELVMGCSDKAGIAFDNQMAKLAERIIADA